MRPLTRLAIIGATTLALGILAFGGWYWVLGGPERHLDGQGPLASRGTSNTQVTHGFYPSGGPVWTVGIPLCLLQGADPAVLDGPVKGTTVAGDGLRYLGTRVRVFLPGSQIELGSTGGFPPTGLGPLQEAAGFHVTHPCQFSNPDPSVSITELDVGVAEFPGSAGGGWMGLDIGYTDRGHHHVLSTGWNILACGPAMPAVYCPTT